MMVFRMMISRLVFDLFFFFFKIEFTNNARVLQKEDRCIKLPVTQGEV